MGDGGFAWGLMISSADGNVLLSGVKWGAGFNEVEIEEAMACFFFFLLARQHGRRGYKSYLQKGFLNLDIQTNEKMLSRRKVGWIASSIWLLKTCVCLFLSSIY